MPLMTYINDRMTATYIMLKPFSKIFLVPLVNITYPLLHQHFPVLPAWQSIDIIVRNISTVVNTCVDIINRQQVKDIYTYAKYSSTLSLLLSTYQTSCLKGFSSMYCTRSLPIRWTPCMKTEVSPSVGPSDLGIRSTSSCMYKEQNVKTSLSMYALAIDPSGLKILQCAKPPFNWIHPTILYKYM